MSSVVSSQSIEHLRSSNPQWIRSDLGDLDALAKSMKRHGQLWPIVASVVDGQLRIIDGARRIEAASMLGWLEVSVTCTSDFFAISRILRENNGSAAGRNCSIPMTWIETMELISIMRSLYNPVARQRSIDTKRHGLERGVQRHSGIALDLPAALNIPHSRINELGRAWTMLNDGKYSHAQRERMRQAIREVEASGKVFSLLSTMRRAACPPLPRTSDKAKLFEQRQLLPRAITTLRGAVMALPDPEMLDPAHSKEDLVNWSRGLTDVIRTINAMRKKINKIQGDQG